MIFNPEAKRILEGFGITDEEHKELINKYVVGSPNDIIFRVVESTDLTQAQKYAILLGVGILMVGYTVEEMALSKRRSQGLVPEETP